jgi:hypothetical protein
MYRKEVEKIKAFLSKQEDKARLAYDRKRTDRPRQWIAIGTNNNTKDYLRDVTGNRRFYPFTIRGTVNVEAIEKDRDQLWAEAVEAEKTYGPLMLPVSVHADAKAAQDARLEIAEPERRLTELLSVLDGGIVFKDEVWAAMGLHDVARRLPSHGQMIARVTDNLKWKDHRPWADRNKNIRDKQAYKKGESEIRYVFEHGRFEEQASAEIMLEDFLLENAAKTLDPLRTNFYYGGELVANVFEEHIVVSRKALEDYLAKRRMHFALFEKEMHDVERIDINFPDEFNLLTGSLKDHQTIMTKVVRFKPKKT